MGFLSALPYLCLRLWYLLHDMGGSQQVTSILGFIGVPFGFICGFPFGLTAIILGLVALFRKSKQLGRVILAILGILLGIYGIIEHVWYFETCQFCQ